ncbi:GspH/FimT family pseudopilin [Stenotrophomonas sp.]|uniref:GspH/FimT family pseudopilin n=1 Tax=Stenotrophomonas sp. TaxID=69392 RepID=UPI002D3A60DE|nr:GspH/FimT family pseudopilin [Stenotrophomonas sp.]HYQ21986.1 GspH/FimT family pseudopilin [Stenotrophomonas sp.]
MNPPVSTMAAAAGFTLLELMITVAVLAILVTVAVPSFTAMIARNQITAAGNDLIAALQFARHEAVRRNAAVQVCASGDGQDCSDAGWQTWVVRTGNGTVLRTVQIPGMVSALPQGAFIQGVQFDSTGLFHGRGSQEPQGSVLFCSARTDRRLQLEATSGIRLQLVAAAPGVCA